MTNPLIVRRDAFAARCPEERVRLNGRDWGVIEAGDAGPVLVLIPGTLGRADIFWQQIEALEDRARLLVPTYPVTGGIAEWSADLLALFDQRGISRARLLGTSLGGYLAQYFASVHPERVETLLPANTMVATEASRARIPAAFDLDHGPVAELRATFHTRLEAWRTAHPDQSDLVDLLLGEVDGRIPEAELRTRLRALMDPPPLGPVTIPPERVATIESADDPRISEDRRNGVRARHAPATVYRFLWGGHFPYVVRPEAYTGLLETELGLSLTGAPWPGGPIREA
ncbi:alpha/beta hydrolase [Acuticoccus sp. M5D2P5]|uniref:alpha/beta fold hydrolase n=1 Tax=Acuticoccus kalidii TaxID=2910977 RepID=UPI001F2EFC1E|nr:alpha/beta hydrolase [Acuticoccus kalidii]MCF3935076.1 alpha/beta hydrolase [Acuticoccus kalidii]